MTKAMEFFISIMLYAIFGTSAKAAIRSNIVIHGTTIGPDFIRESEKSNILYPKR